MITPLKLYIGAAALQLLASATAPGADAMETCPNTFADHPIVTNVYGGNRVPECKKFPCVGRYVAHHKTQTAHSTHGYRYQICVPEEYLGLRQSESACDGTMSNQPCSMKRLKIIESADSSTKKKFGYTNSTDATNIWNILRDDERTGDSYGTLSSGNQNSDLHVQCCSKNSNQQEVCQRQGSRSQTFRCNPTTTGSTRQGCFSDTTTNGNVEAVTWWDGQQRCTVAGDPNVPGTLALLHR